ncbi:MAG: hypothetical protein K2G12_06005 [Prevotella sp.]|nr:hypothetical protein [Prevotella sp.]
MKTILAMALCTLILSCHSGKTQTATEQESSGTETERLETVSLKQLSGTEWVQISPKCRNSYQIIGFSDSTFTRKITIRQILSTWKFRFYLSDGIPERFDSSRVGISDSGTHIVKYNSDSRSILCNKVISLHGDTLTLYSKNEPGSIVEDIHDTVFVFKRLCPISSKQLAGTAWKHAHNADSPHSEIYEFRSKVVINAGPTDYEDAIFSTKTYYLSSTADESFDPSKVGKPSSGCHLYLQDVRDHRTEDWLIESFDEEKGIMVINFGEYFHVTGEVRKWTLKRVSPK